MFDNDYEFRGIHAMMVKELTKKFDSKTQIFNRNMDVYLLAPIIGFSYQRKAELNKSEGDTSIFYKTISNHKDELFLNYRLIILLDANNCPDIDERIDRAFRIFGKEETKGDLELYNQYVRGGIEVIYEKIYGSGSNLDDFLKNLYDFMDEIAIRNEDITNEAITELCKAKRNK